MAQRILVVDDEPEFGTYVGDVARGLGYQVEITTNADAFMQVYDKFDPSIIVLDVVMPEIDGIELLKWLSERECTAKIIIVTGYNPNYASMATTLGGRQGLNTLNVTKPISVQDLRELIG